MYFVNIRHRFDSYIQRHLLPFIEHPFTAPLVFVWWIVVTTFGKGIDKQKET